STSATPKSSRPRRSCPCTSSALFREWRRRLWAAQSLRSCLHRPPLNAPELSPMDAWVRCPVLVCTLYLLLHQLKTQATPLEVDAWARCPVLVCKLYRLLHHLKTQATPLEVDTQRRSTSLQRLHRHR